MIARKKKCFDKSATKKQLPKKPEAVLRQALIRTPLFFFILIASRVTLTVNKNRKRGTFIRRQIDRNLIEKPLHTFGLETYVDGSIEV